MTAPAPRRFSRHGHSPDCPQPNRPARRCVCRSELLAPEPIAGRIPAAAAMGHATAAATVTHEQLVDQAVLTSCQACFAPVPDDGSAHVCWTPATGSST